MRQQVASFGSRIVSLLPPDTKKGIDKLGYGRTDPREIEAGSRDYVFVARRSVKETT